MLAQQPAQVRHPLDPDPVRATKAPAVFVLGLVGALTGIFVGGLVAATLALILSRQARREAYQAGGFLTGLPLVRRGERLAWIGIALAATAIVVALVIGLYRYANSPAGQDFGPGVD
jgi:(hydroxyamino)benzene mutase